MPSSAARSCGDRPAVMNCSSRSPDGARIPSAPYRAPPSSIAVVTIRCSTAGRSRSPPIASTADSNPCRRSFAPASARSCAAMPSGSPASAAPSVRLAPPAAAAGPCPDLGVSSLIEVNGTHHHAARTAQHAATQPDPPFTWQLTGIQDHTPDTGTGPASRPRAPPAPPCAPASPAEGSVPTPDPTSAHGCPNAPAPPRHLGAPRSRRAPSRRSTAGAVDAAGHPAPARLVRHGRRRRRRARRVDCCTDHPPPAATVRIADRQALRLPHTTPRQAIPPTEAEN